MTKKLAVLLFVFSFAFSVCAFAFYFESGPAKVSLVELYSSEGCSSCPVAEKWMSRLKGDARLFKDYVPVAFHVDYWDNLGWKDPFDSNRYTARQNRYAARWGSDTVYTPGFVLDGQMWRGWGYDDAPSKPDGRPGVLKLWQDELTYYDVSFEPADAQTGGEWKVCGAILAFDKHSKVTAGENAGSELVHDFVVLQYEEKPMRVDRDKLVGKLVDLLPPPADGKYAIAVWVSRGDDPAPVQALGAYLS